MAKVSQRVLIVLFGALGDVTRALPLAVRLKRSWPECHLTWAVEPKSREILQLHPAVDRVIVFERGRGFAGYVDFVKQMRCEPYDVVLDLQRHLKSGVTSWLSQSSKRIGFHRRNAKEFNWIFNSATIPEYPQLMQKLDHYQKFGDYLGLQTMEQLEFGIEPSVEISLRAEQLIAAGALARGLDALPAARRAILILGSTWPTKFWSVENFSELARELFLRRGILPLAVGASSERAFLDQMYRLDPALPVVDLVGKTSLAELIGVLAAARFAVGTDSGPMHLAAALKKPVISLWGPTSPLRSAPYNNESLLLQSPLGCSPCYSRSCPGLDRLCMRSIPAEAVLARVSQILDV